MIVTGQDYNYNIYKPDPEDDVEGLSTKALKVRKEMMDFTYSGDLFKLKKLYDKKKKDLLDKKSDWSVVNDNAISPDIIH